MTSGSCVKEQKATVALLKHNICILPSSGLYIIVKFFGLVAYFLRYSEETGKSK